MSNELGLPSGDEEESDEDVTISDAIMVRNKASGASNYFAAKYVDGEGKFFNVECHTRALERVVLPKGLLDPKKRNPNLTKIVKDLQTKRDKVFEQLLAARGCTPPKVGGKQLKTRYSHKKCKSTVLTLPLSCSIELEPGLQVKVICSRPKSKLWVEVSKAFIKWISRKACEGKEEQVNLEDESYRDSPGGSEISDPPVADA
jgi:hypothetical protein